MNEIIKSAHTETNTDKEKRRIEEVENLPESVRALFDKLADSTINKIFPPEENGESQDSQENHGEKLKEAAAGFDEKTREEFMARCLGELFELGRFKDVFADADENNLQQEIYRLLDLLWQNRGKGDDVRLFNEESYKRFFETRDDFEAKIKVQTAEAKKLKVDIEKTKKQKRLTEQKTQKSRVVEEKIHLLMGELKKYDNRHGNSDLDHIYFRDVLSRQEKEKKWTTTAAIISEYFAPAEFATVMAERLEKTFYKESDIAKAEYKRFGGKTPSEDIIKRAKKVIDSAEKAIEEWSVNHENDEIFKKSTIMTPEERQVKIIAYLRSLIDSYLRGKNDKRTDEEMVYTVRQMEVTLNLLGR